MRMSITLAAILLSAAGAEPAAADDYLKIRHVTETVATGREPQPAGDEVVEVWLGADRARMDTGAASSVILDEPAQRLYVLDHKEKTYTEVPMDLTRAVSEMAGSDETAQMVAGLMGTMLKVDAQVVDTGVDRKFGRWDCRAYRMTLAMAMGRTESEVCATPDIDVPRGLYYRLANVMLAGQEGFQDAMREMEKIKGLPVHTESTVTAMDSTIRTTDDLLDHAKGDAPAGTYDLPQGYTKKAFTGF